MLREEKFDTGKNNTQMERKEKQFPSYDKKKKRQYVVKSSPQIKEGESSKTYFATFYCDFHIRSCKQTHEIKRGWRISVTSY